MVKICGQIYQREDVKYDIEWGLLYNNDCQICKPRNECKVFCKHRNSCKLYVMNGEEDVIKMKRMNVNVKLPSRGTARAAGSDMVAAETTVVPVLHAPFSSSSAGALQSSAVCFLQI